MIKKLLLVLLFGLAACGGGEVEVIEKIVEVERTVVVTSPAEIIEKVVEVEVIVEVIVTPPTPTESPCPPGWPTDTPGMEWDTCPETWGVSYYKPERDLWEYELLGVNAKGLPIFSKTNIPHLAGSIIVVFNTFNGVSYGHAFDELANAQAFYQEDGVWLKEFPGRWRGDGVVFAYEIAGEYGAGRFVLADHGSFPECDDLDIKYPESCQQ